MKYLYRIVNAIFAALVFPAALFLDGIIFRASTTLADAGLVETMTFKKIIDILMGNDTFFGIPVEPGTMSWPSALDPAKGRLIATVVCFALVIIAALFIFFWSVFSNKRLPVVIAAAAGIISTIVMTTCFHSATSLLTEGVINVVELFTDSWLMSLLGGIINIDTLAFAGFQNGIIICFVLVLVWTGAFYIIEIGEPKEEKAKKEKKTKK